VTVVQPGLQDPPATRTQPSLMRTDIHGVVAPGALLPELLPYRLKQLDVDQHASAGSNTKPQVKAPFGI
jgi:hypothetical protein